MAQGDSEPIRYTASTRVGEGKAQTTCTSSSDGFARVSRALRQYSRPRSSERNRACFSEKQMTPKVRDLNLNAVVMWFHSDCFAISSPPRCNGYLLECRHVTHHHEEDHPHRSSIQGAQKDSHDSIHVLQLPCVTLTSFFDYTHLTTQLSGRRVLRACPIAYEAWPNRSYSRIARHSRLFQGAFRWTNHSDGHRVHVALQTCFPEVGITVERRERPRTFNPG